MLGPSRANRLHIVVHVRGRGRQRERRGVKSWKVWKLWRKGRRGDYSLWCSVQIWLMFLIISAISHSRSSPVNLERSTRRNNWEMRCLKSARWRWGGGPPSPPPCPPSCVFYQCWPAVPEVKTPVGAVAKTHRFDWRPLETLRPPVTHTYMMLSEFLGYWLRNKGSEFICCSRNMPARLKRQQYTFVRFVNW